MVPLKREGIHTYILKSVQPTEICILANIDFLLFILVWTNVRLQFSRERAQKCIPIYLTNKFLKYNHYQNNHTHPCCIVHAQPRQTPNNIFNHTIFTTLFPREKPHKRESKMSVSKRRHTVFSVTKQQSKTKHENKLKERPLQPQTERVVIVAAACCRCSTTDNKVSEGGHCCCT